MKRKGNQPNKLDVVKKSDYINFLKNKCPMCNENFENSWEHYKKFGNYCVKCSNAISKRMYPAMLRYNERKRRAKKKLDNLKNKGRKIKSKK